MTRPVCPSCGSRTGYGDLICFKCGILTNRFRFTQEYFKTTKHFKHQNKNEIFHDVVYDFSKWPVEALRWVVVKCGLTLQNIKDNKIGYIKNRHALFIPTLDLYNNVLFYQLRFLKNKEYRFIGNSRGVIDIRGKKQNDTIVIVEDKMSQIRVGEHQECLCLNTTKLTGNMVRYLVRNYETIVFWLDPDKEGQTGTLNNYTKLQNAFSNLYIKTFMSRNLELAAMQFKKVSNKRYTEDPKRYNYHEIQEALTTAKQYTPENSKYYGKWKYKKFNKQQRSEYANPLKKFY